MRKVNNLILSVISLIVTTGLLVLIIYSWYVTNEKATVSGITASSESNTLYISTTYGSGYNTYNEVNDYVSTFTNLDTDYWKSTATISNNNQLLLPTSSPNGSVFYYTPDVNSDGTANRKYMKVAVTQSTFTTDGSLYTYTNGSYVSVNSGEYDSTKTYYKYQYDFMDVTSLGTYYYIEEDLYVCNDSEKDLVCSIRKVDISQGSDDSSNIYKSARIYVESSNNDQIFRYYDENDANSGIAYPANSLSTVSNSDPSHISGIIGDNVISFNVPGAVTENDVTTYTAVKIKLKIWVEGQNTNANATYAGTGFNIGLTFVTI